VLPEKNIWHVQVARQGSRHRDSNRKSFEKKAFAGDSVKSKVHKNPSRFSSYHLKPSSAQYEHAQQNRISEAALLAAFAVVSDATVDALQFV
jgi:hypothetical protein